MSRISKQLNFFKSSSPATNYAPIPLQEQVSTTVDGQVTEEFGEDGLAPDTGLERKLVKRLDRSLMPVLFGMIVLKYVNNLFKTHYAYHLN